MKRIIVSTASRNHVQRRNERLSMRKIERLGLNPGACWVDLVGWHLHNDRLLSAIVTDDTAALCRQDAACNGLCYCGKFATAAMAAELGFTSIIVEASNE